MAKVDMWMPLYIADYLADTAYLTTEQSGAYLHLLMAYWRNGPPPDNNGILSSITKLSPDAWSIARSVLEPFFEVVDGAWVHKRVEQEITKASKNRNSAHERAVKAAAARWAKPDNASGMLGALPEDKLKQCPSPSPSPTPIPTQSPSQKPVRAPRASRLAENWELPREWAEWSLAETPAVSVIAEAAKFRDYWVAKSGKDGTKNSWEATWRNWCRRVQERAGSQPQQFMTATQRRAAGTDEAIRQFLAADTECALGAIDHDPR